MRAAGGIQSPQPGNGPQSGAGPHQARRLTRKALQWEQAPPLFPLNVRPDTRTHCSHWPSVLTTGTLQSSLRTSEKVSRERQGLARPSPQLLRPPVWVRSPGRQALTKPGGARERPAGSRTWGTVLPRGQAGPAPHARALPPSRGLAGSPSRFCTTEASVATALSEKPSPRTNSLMLHAHLRCTPRVAGVKDACLRAHSGAAGRDPSYQSLLPNSRNTSGLRTEAATGPAGTAPRTQAYRTDSAR
ncbi:unnamed protein product [Rangifer tarandus platyrhynchus]|uniref:Uncharacterized protein n=1 Tax=Rangifer tarandus platyrhynchus TaxID=3082113 RepID=A0ABN8ZUB2_RANTA|nr:unnamed protein product [Rangifer tarandus platyrhynchus]